MKRSIGFHSRPTPHGTRWRPSVTSKCDDSKATNPGAALAALAQAGGPVLWILGGRDKGMDFDELRHAAFERVRVVLLIGEARGTLASLLAPHARVVDCETLERAVSEGFALAEPGDTILLAPACASFDQFASYAERGERFARLASEVAA